MQFDAIRQYTTGKCPHLQIEDVPLPWITERGMRVYLHTYHQRKLTPVIFCNLPIPLPTTTKKKTPFQQGKNCQDTNIRAGESSNLRFLSRVWILSLLSMLHFLSMRMWCVSIQICYINCLSLYVYVKWCKKVESIELLELWKLHGVERRLHLFRIRTH